MKTAMQELKWFISDGLNNFDESIKVSEIWDKLEELLEKEKQQIMDAVIETSMHGETMANEQAIAMTDKGDRGLECLGRLNEISYAAQTTLMKNAIFPKVNVLIIDKAFGYDIKVWIVCRSYER